MDWNLQGNHASLYLGSKGCFQLSIQKTAEGPNSGGSSNQNILFFVQISNFYNANPREYKNEWFYFLSDSGVESGSAPVFVVSFNDVNLGESSESVNAYFEAQLEPKGDPGVTLQWKLNGKELQDSKLKKNTL